MPTIDDVYGGNTLKDEDLPQDFRAVLRVESVSVQEFEDRDTPGKMERKFVARFVGKEKGLALNVTNANILAEIAGSRDSDYWPGKLVVMYRTMAEFRGKRVPAIRLDHPPKNAPAARPAPPPPPPQREAGEDFVATDDDIPF